MKVNKVIFDGSMWMSLSQIINQVLTFSVTIIMARILNPEDFGIVAISSVIVGFISLFSQLGMGAAIIQRKAVNDDYLSTAFWISMGSGVTFFMLSLIISPVVSLIYDKDILQSVIVVTSIGFILAPMTAIHTSILTKELNFKHITIINILKVFVASLLSLCLALLGYGVWSLVFGGVIAQLLLVPIIWKIVDWRPKFIFDKKCFSDMFSFSSYILAFNCVNYFSRNSDDLIIGKVLGANMLGYYSMAYSLMKKPLQYFSSAVGAVLFPVFSGIKDDKEQIISSYLKVIRMISFITFPMMIGLILVANEFVAVVYSEKWLPVVVPLQILCVVGAVQSIESVCGNIFLSQGRSDIQFKWSLYFSFLCIMSFILGVKWGLNGVATCYAIVVVVNFPIGNYIATKLIGMRYTEFVKALVPASLSTSIMAVALLCYRYIVTNYIEISNGKLLASSIVIGIITYSLTLYYLFKTQEVDDLVVIIKQKLNCVLT